MIKKRFLSIGSIAILIPIASVISCGTYNNNSHHNNDKPVTPNQENGYKVNHDGLYILKKDYNGTLLNDSTLSTKDEVKGNRVEIKQSSSKYALDNSVQLGDGDSIYMLYDSDDKDGLTASNFTSTVLLEDTSIMQTQAILEINQKLGNVVEIQGFSSSTYVKFKKNDQGDQGIINKYAGGQNNHVSKTSPFATPADFQKSIQDFVKGYVNFPDVIKAVLQYYGLKTTAEADGHYAKDPSLSGASEGFAPVFATNDVFTYKKVADNAIKITFHSDKHYALTAGHFVIKENGKYMDYGSFSVGGQSEWNSYYGHPEAKYVATKRFNK